MPSISSYYYHFYSMGTRFDLIIPGTKPFHSGLPGKEIENLLQYWHGKLNRFDPDSDLSVINRLASSAPYPLDNEMFEVFNLCEKYVSMTDSIFDPALLSLQQAWESGNFGKRPWNLEELREGSGWKHVHLDDANRTIHFDHPLTGIDLGGFAKGFALQIVKQNLSDYGIKNALVSFGESTILAMGQHPHGPHWPVGIRNVFGLENLFTFPLSDTSLSVSGITLQHMPHAFTGYLHILSPQTGFPVTGFRLEAVECADPLDAEILSTSMMVAGPSGQDKLIQHFSPRRHVSIKWSEKKPEIITSKPTHINV